MTLGNVVSPEVLNSSGVTADAYASCEGDDCSSGVYDCAGVCDGDAAEDECGVCGGDGSSCAGVDGCTDSSACNYNPDATDDDGTCEYPLDECTACDGSDLGGQDCTGECGGNTLEVQIDNQIWCTKNLKVTHYNDGTEIASGYSNSEWANIETGAYTIYHDIKSNGISRSPTLPLMLHLLSHFAKSD